MDRRRALLSTFAGAAALSIAGRAVAAEAHAAQKGAGPNREVLESALHCARDGEVCLVPACTALAQLAALKSPRLAEFAKAVVLICKDCEAQCRKHADHHDFCKDCADSCLACIKACESLN